MSPQLPPKKEVALALLEKSSVFVHLDPRRDQVVVPPWFRKQPQLVLQIGLNLAVPIPDLELDDESVSCTLSFNRSPFFCWIPWAAIYALVGEDGRGMVWPDDIPPEVAAQAQKMAARQGSTQTTSPARRAHLRSVGSEDKPAEPDPAETAAASPAEVPAEPTTQGSAEQPAEPPPAQGADSEAPSEGRSSKRPPWLRVVK